VVEALRTLKAENDRIKVQNQALETRVVGLDVCFIHTLPVLMASRHSRASGNPGDEGHGDWMPAYAGMTFSWYRTGEMDI
jgi:hypothetical protein